MLLLVVFEKATRLFVLVGLTTTKLSAWLPAVALTFTTGAVQTNGTDGARRSVGTHGRSLGFMHLRVPSRTWMLPRDAGTSARQAGGRGVRKTKEAAGG